MTANNKSILEQANAAITADDNGGFLAFCADDTEWTFVGDKVLKGKAAVRQWMAETYLKPPKFNVANLIADNDFVVALGSIVTPGEAGKAAASQYCDVWRFRDGKIVGLKAFVIQDDAAAL